MECEYGDESILNKNAYNYYNSSKDKKNYRISIKNNSINLVKVLV